MTHLPVSANVEKEILEISSDFAKPIEVLRESLHNSYDAGATQVRIVAKPDYLPDRRRVLTITVSDDGQGMSAEMLSHFFGLGWSEKPVLSDRRKIGFKGHGTKIFYQAGEIAVLTRQAEAEPFFALLKDARRSLNQGHCPAPERLDPNEAARADLHLIGPTGTSIRLLDFTADSGKLIDAFFRRPVESYLRWFTIFRSFQHVVNETKPSPPLQLWLQGADDSSPRPIEFGHRWPDADVTSLKVLKSLLEQRCQMQCQKNPRPVPKNGRNG